MIVAEFRAGYRCRHHNGQQLLPIDWAHLMETHAEILEAYFALRQEREATTIGTGEIVQWMRARTVRPLSR